MKPPPACFLSLEMNGLTGYLGQVVDMMAESLDHLREDLLL